MLPKLKAIDVAGLALNISLYVAVGYIFYSLIRTPYGGVRSCPPVIVPAVFAVGSCPLSEELALGGRHFISDALSEATAAKSNGGRHERLCRFFPELGTLLKRKYVGQSAVFLLTV